MTTQPDEGSESQDDPKDTRQACSYSACSSTSVEASLEDLKSETVAFQAGCLAGLQACNAKLAQDCKLHNNLEQQKHAAHHALLQLLDLEEIKRDMWHAIFPSGQHMLHASLNKIVITFLDADKGSPVVAERGGNSASVLLRNLIEGWQMDLQQHPLFGALTEAYRSKRALFKRSEDACREMGKAERMVHIAQAILRFSKTAHSIAEAKLSQQPVKSLADAYQTARIALRGQVNSALVKRLKRIHHVCLAYATGMSKPQWFYCSIEGPVGPLCNCSVLELLALGRLRPDSKIWRQGDKANPIKVSAFLKSKAYAATQADAQPKQSPSVTEQQPSQAKDTQPSIEGTPLLTREEAQIPETKQLPLQDEIPLSEEDVSATHDEDEPRSEEQSELLEEQGACICQGQGAEPRCSSEMNSIQETYEAVPMEDVTPEERPKKQSAEVKRLLKAADGVKFGPPTDTSTVVRMHERLPTKAAKARSKPISKRKGSQALGPKKLPTKKGKGRVAKPTKKKKGKPAGKATKPSRKSTALKIPRTPQETEEPATRAQSFSPSTEALPANFRSNASMTLVEACESAVQTPPALDGRKGEICTLSSADLPHCPSEADECSRCLPLSAQLREASHENEVAQEEKPQKRKKGAKRGRPKKAALGGRKTSLTLQAKPPSTNHRALRCEQRALAKQGFLTEGQAWMHLKARTKQLKFGKSRVHAWGLFAQELIPPEEFLIEYVGEVIPSSMEDLRERQYQAEGLDSSYLFRIDKEYVIDATKKGGMARYINHSCDPNCYTKIMTVEGRKHVVLFSKSALQPGDELCYNYNFSFEKNEEAVPCLCGAKCCIGRLN